MLESNRIFCCPGNSGGKVVVSIMWAFAYVPKQMLEAKIALKLASSVYKYELFLNP